MLVLFTSYQLLRQVYVLPKEKAVPNSMQILGQGMDDGSRRILMQRFMKHPSSVLLGASSFWEGIDLPGDALTCLAIVRLPFQPPNHPIMQAKVEKITKEKKILSWRFLYRKQR